VGYPAGVKIDTRGALQDVQEDPDRIRHPLRRVGDGPDSVAFYRGNPIGHNYGLMTHLDPARRDPHQEQFFNQFRGRTAHLPRARLTSRVGSITVPVEATEDMMEGVECLPHGYGHDRPGVALAVAGPPAGASYNDVVDDIPRWIPCRATQC